MPINKTITVFGASGRVGRLVVSLALAEGYSVIAQVHTHTDLPDHPRLIVVQGDIHDPKIVTESLRQSNAVIMTLSSWGSPKKDVLTSAVNHIIPAMRGMGITRIITLTGADARATGDELSLIHRLSHLLISIVNRKVLKDGEQHIALLEHSQLDWTTIRSPIMNDHSSTIHTLSEKRPLPWHAVSRQAVASALLAQLSHGHYSQQSPFIA